jgi:hypothetical protein
VQLLVSLCVLLYVATVTVVGVRMLLLARRTRGVPELTIGAGSVLICGVGFPASVASGFGGVIEAVNAPLWIASELVTQIGIVLLYVFTQQVFRPGVRWARALVACVAVYLPLALVGAAAALSAAQPGEHSVRVARGELLLCFAGYAGCFVWSAVESLRHYGMARRRQALGLADAVVANRFLLWGCYGLAATGIIAANAVGVVLGHNISTSPVVLLPAGVLGFAASIAIYLVFLPPAWFLARLRTADGRTDPNQRWDSRGSSGSLPARKSSR